MGDRIASHYDCIISAYCASWMDRPANYEYLKTRGLFTDIFHSKCENPGLAVLLEKVIRASALLFARHD